MEDIGLESNEGLFGSVTPFIEQIKNDMLSFVETHEATLGYTVLRMDEKLRLQSNVPAIELRGME